MTVRPGAARTRAGVAPAGPRPEDGTLVPAPHVGLGAVVRSPYAAFCLWIVVGAVLLQLRWSTLFEAPRIDFWLTLGLAFVVFLMLALTARAMPPIADRERVRWANVVVITLYFALAYAVSGGVPVLLILEGAPYDIYSFGVPGLHIVAISYTGYYGVRLFRALLAERSARHAVMFVWVTALMVSMGSRSALSFLAFACLVVFVRARRLRAPAVVFAGAAVLAFLLAFGQFGDTRLGFQIEQATGQAASTTAIVNYSRASPAFEATGLPALWLWPYLYMASPLANLNSAFEYSAGAVCGRTCDVGGLVLYELTPDVVGVRLADALGVEAFDKGAFLISPDLTASTTFGPAVGYAGVVGAVAVLGALVLVGFAVTGAIRGTPLQEEGVALLATFYFFAFFANMLAYSALSLQLAWLVLDAVRFRRRRRRNDQAHGRGAPSPTVRGASVRPGRWP